MKSKTFCSDYAKTQFKKQLWMMGLLAFLLFLVLPVALMIDIGNLEHAHYSLFERQKAFKLFMLRSEMLLLMVMVTGFLTAVYQFRYLHSRRMVDFFHSFPVKKEKLYQIHVVTAYLDFVIPYTLMVGICILLGLLHGIMTAEAFGVCLAVWFLYQVAFLLVYAVAAVAMLLTGREFVGVLGTVVFLFLPMVISSAIDWYQIEFFNTYIGYYNTEKWLFRLSPGYAPWQTRSVFLSDVNKGIYLSSDILQMAVIMIIFLAAFLVIGYYLMKKRPSEAAGSSMAFSIPARVIHVILCIVGALYVGMFVYGMTDYNSILWLMAGVLFGGFILYILIQFIYTIDFRKVLRYKWQLLLVEVVSVGIAAMFCFDWVGYDAYIPSKDNLYSVAISIPDGLQYDSYLVDGEYIDAESYRMEHMNLVVTDELYEMLQDTIVLNEDLDEGISEDELTENGTFRVPVRYKLKNGRERNRIYQMDLNKYQDLFISLYGQAEFKNAMMPIYGMLDSDKTYELYLSFENEYTALFGDDQEKTYEFVQVLKRDFEKRSGDTFVNEIPIATIDLNVKELEQSYGLYIYPSSKEVISYLVDSGYSLESCLKLENILKIVIEDYRKDRAEEENAYEETTGAYESAETISSSKIIVESATSPVYTEYTDPEEIAQIFPALVSCDYYNTWVDTCGDLYVVVTMIGKDGYQIQMGYELLEDKLPEFLK